MARPFVGETFGKTVGFTTTEISEFAALCGDMNPLHHDPEFAAGTRFGGIIASGLQVNSILTAMVADHYTKSNAMLGLEIHYTLRAAAYPDQPLAMRWTVQTVEPKPKLNGDIVTLDGTVTGPGDETIVTATMKALVAPSV